MRDLMLVAFAADIAGCCVLTPPGNTGLWVAFLIFQLSRGTLQTLRYPAMVQASSWQAALQG